MKKMILAITVISVVAACKKENKPAVVGTNDQGQELVVNETGDTVVYVAPAKSEEEIIDEKEEVTAIKAETDGKYNFGLNLKKGQKYPFKIVTSATTSESDGKQSATTTQESTTSLEYVVKEVKDSTFVLDVTYKQFAEKLSNGKESIGFDTNAAEPTDEMVKQRYKFNKAIVGNTFQMEVSETGKVKNINNLWNVRDKVKNAIKTGLKTEEVAALDKFLQSALSDEAMQQMFEESLAYYPKKAVKPGDTWSRDESQGTASSKVTYTFDGITGDMATIKINGTSSGNDSQTDPNGSGMKIFQSLDGKVNGTVHINVNTGWISDAEMNKDETIRMTQEFQGQKANFSSQTKSKTKIN